MFFSSSKQDNSSSGSSARQAIIACVCGVTLSEHRGQTFAHARVVGRAELSARTKTEEKYISGRLHKAPEKRVNTIMRG